MHQNRPQQDKNRQADVETGAPQDPRDRRMPGEGAPDAGRSSQQTQQGGSHQGQQGGVGKPTTQQGGSTKDQKQPTQQATAGEQYGEGNYTASRHYSDGARHFAESGNVEQAARDAAPRDQGEAREMRDAEQAGKARMKDENPELDRAKPRKPGKGPDE